MEVKSYNHQSIAEWSNSKTHSDLLACAQLNPDQNNMYNIDILSLDLSDRCKNLNVIGNAFYNVAFRCLAWDTFGQKQNTYPHGVIFGGMQDGSYSLWNASEMILNHNRNNLKKTQQNIQNQSSFLYGQQAEDGAYPIMCAEWNSLKNNYLAFGSTDLLILDIGKDISNPQIKKTGTRNPHEGSYITSVSWNKQVAHILASASQNGLIALWDVKANNPSTNAANRNVSICWSKTISTQLSVTLDDQKRNELQIWDLRNQKGPVAVFQRGHTKGINTMQWCQTDPELILTGGRDNKIVCWNYTQEQAPISSYDLDSAIFDVKWSKKLRSIYSVSLQDRTQIYTLDNTNLFSYVPKWYRVPVSSTFLGNDVALRYSENQGQKLIQTRIPSLNSSQNSNLQFLLKQLQSSLDQNAVRERNQQSQFWNLINIKNSHSGDDAIFNYLGFNKQKIVKQVEKYTGKKRQNVQVKTQAQPKYKSKAYTPVIGQQAASFFASIGQNNSKNVGLPIQQDQENESVKYDMVPRNFNWNIGKQRLIKHNILIGNYEGAIDAAIKCGRTAEALIIAYSVDTNTFNSTLKTFFTETTDNFITDVLKNITYRDNQELVRKWDLQSWKQCVAMIYSISASQKRRSLLNLLASRIRQQILRKTGKSNEEIISEDNPAIQCYILSQNFNQIANLYFDSLKNLQSGTIERKQTVVQYAKRLILIFNSLSVETQPCKNFQKIIRQAAFIATQQNFKMVSYMILSTYLYETSMKEVDMIIHATKNLEQYRNSIVFKQINIPVMQFKQTSQNQKSKKGPSQHPVHQQNNKLGQNMQHNVNVNVPTKDKNVPRPPIFNKREQQKQVVNTKINNMPPPPPGHRQRNPVHDHQEEVQTIDSKKLPIKKIPPPGFKPGVSKTNEIISNPSLSYQQNQNQDYQHQHQEANQPHYEQKKSVPPPPSVKKGKIPPPPSSNISTNISHHQDVHQTSIISQHSQPQEIKRNVPPIPANRIPPPSKNMTKQQHYQEEDEPEEEQAHQQITNSQKFIQPQLNMSDQKRAKVPPPPPSNTMIPKPPGIKNTLQNDNFDQNSSFNQIRSSETNYNKPPQFASSKKNIPPPPPVKKQISHEDYEEPTSRVKQQAIKPPPSNKTTSKNPPPPNRMQIHTNKPNQSQQNYSAQQYSVQQQYVPHQQQYAPQQKHIPQQQYSKQQQAYEQPEERQPQYETPVIKRPPPSISGKKGPPPPPKR